MDLRYLEDSKGLMPSFLARHSKDYFFVTYFLSLYVFCHPFPLHGMQPVYKKRKILLEVHLRVCA